MQENRKTEDILKNTKQKRYENMKTKKKNQKLRPKYQKLQLRLINHLIGESLQWRYKYVLTYSI